MVRFWLAICMSYSVRKARHLLLGRVIYTHR
jgi:hypothetical protein